MAYVAPDAVVDPTATVLPFAAVMSGAKIGARSVLYPGVYVGRGASVGNDTELRAHVVVEAFVEVGDRVLVHGGTVLGADGFGFAPGPKGLEKIPQTGRVIIGHDVEVGALCTVDRGALEDTVVGSGTKLDSHVHVGHGVTIGQHSILCAFVGIAGSAHIGSGVVLGGHVGVSNKVRIADGIQVGAMAGVTKDLAEKGTYMGFPAGPAGEWRRQIAGARRMPERIAELEKKIRELEKALKPAE
jgi:UDP-3-O-[3-hydroxymyristoyl] glucosamine N-acyltransferase